MRAVAIRVAGLDLACGERKPDGVCLIIVCTNPTGARLHLRLIPRP